MTIDYEKAAALHAAQRAVARPSPKRTLRSLILSTAADPILAMASEPAIAREPVHAVRTPRRRR